MGAVGAASGMTVSTVGPSGAPVNLQDEAACKKLLDVNYVVDFPNAKYVVNKETGETNHLSFFSENITKLTAPRFDPVTGEKLFILFGVVTKKGPENEVQLAKLIKNIKAAGVHPHTYDAKSGTGLRITRLGVTETRLLEFAEAIEFMRKFDEAAITKASHDIGLVITNPDTSESKDWHRPYEHLSAPYKHAFKHLFMPLTEGERMKLCNLLVQGETYFDGPAKGCGLDISSLEEDGDEDDDPSESMAFCEGVFPIHNVEKKSALEALWMPLDWPQALPVNEIKEYFGEEVGFYFGFLGHYVVGLMYIVPFALVAWVVGVLELSVMEHKAMYSSAVFAIVFTCVYSMILDSWKCKQSSLAHEWSAFGSERALPPRPGFKGQVVKNATNGMLEVDFPVDMRKRNMRLTLAASGSMMFLLLVTTTLIFSWKVTLTNSSKKSDQDLILLPSMLNAVQITIYAIVYKIVADKLTDFENHKTTNEHNAALFRKLTLFYFLSNFSAPLYIAFIKASTETAGCSDPITGESTSGREADGDLDAMDPSDRACGLELSLNVAILFLFNDFGTRMVNSLIVPRLTRMYNEYQIKQDTTTDFSLMGPVEKQHRMLSRYDPTSELIMDYIELYIQWGYLTLFGASCPIVVLFAFVTNFVETRTDGTKLFNDYRRVLPNRVDGIGEPLVIFYYTLYAAVPINCGLVVYAFNAASFVSSSQRIFVVLAILAFMIAFMSQLDEVYPDVSAKTTVQLARQNVVYRHVVLGEASQDGELDFTLTEDHLGLSIESARRQALGGKGQALDEAYTTMVVHTCQDAAWRPSPVAQPTATTGAPAAAIPAPLGGGNPLLTGTDM